MHYIICCFTQHSSVKCAFKHLQILPTKNRKQDIVVKQAGSPTIQRDLLIQCCFDYAVNPLQKNIKHNLQVAQNKLVRGLELESCWQVSVIPASQASSGGPSTSYLIKTILDGSAPSYFYYYFKKVCED